MRQILLVLSLLAVSGISWIDPPGLVAQSKSRSQPSYQWSNAATYGPGSVISRSPLCATCQQFFEILLDPANTEATSVGSPHSSARA